LHAYTLLSVRAKFPAAISDNAVQILGKIDSNAATNAGRTQSAQRAQVFNMSTNS